mmetsp:Transcript_35723/g.90101  ORF Transcript_35723/g.90101 Transcript_35723/m.90101 type:complete len:107 (-) Transcript_35723:179-499(-)
MTWIPSISFVLDWSGGSDNVSLYLMRYAMLRSQVQQDQYCLSIRRLLNQRIVSIQAIMSALLMTRGCMWMRQPLVGKKHRPLLPKRAQLLLHSYVNRVSTHCNMFS